MTIVKTTARALRSPPRRLNAAWRTVSARSLTRAALQLCVDPARELEKHVVECGTCDLDAAQLDARVLGPTRAAAYNTRCTSSVRNTRSSPDRSGSAPTAARTASALTPSASRKRITVAPRALCPIRSVGRPAADDEPVTQDREPVGEMLRLLHVVGREHHRLAEVAKAADHVPRVASRLRVEPGGGLVEEHEIGVADQPERDVDSALLASGQRADALRAVVAQPDERDRLVDVARLREVVGEHGDGLAHRVHRVELALLEHQPDPLAPRTRRPRRIDAEHRHRSGGPAAVALEDLDRGGLARAVRAEQPEDLALADVEVDPLDRLVFAVPLPETADRDDGIAHERGAYPHDLRCMPRRRINRCARRGGPRAPSRRPA